MRGSWPARAIVIVIVMVIVPGMFCGQRKILIVLGVRSGQR